MNSLPLTSSIPPAPPPLRIVHYSPGMRLELGGVVRAVLDWGNVLAGRGHDVTLVTYDSPDVPPDWDGRPGKPKVVWVPPPARSNGLVTPQAVGIWRDVIAGGGVAHLHCPWTASNLQMSKACRAAGAPYVVSIHGMLDDWSMAQRGLKKRLFLALGGRRYLRAAARVHYTAAAEREQGEKWVRGSRAAVLPYLVDLSQFQSLPGKGPALAAFPAAAGAPVILFLSRLHEKKGVHVLIDAAALLRDAGRKFRLLIAGTAGVGDGGYESRLREQVSRLDLGDVVTFLGMAKGVEKISLYQAADLFVLPTQQENFGLVLVEAMAAGTPVVTTRGTDIWREVESAGGTVVDNTPAALSAAFARLLDDRPALAALGARGRDWVFDRLNADRLAGEYEGMYGQVLTESAAKKSSRDQ